MSPEAQRVAIAEACGFSDIGPSEGGQLIGRLHDSEQAYFNVPAYLSDLNAMHEAEEVLTEQWSSYLLCLWGVVNKGQFEAATNTHVANYLNKRAVMATAAQRAEAFLRTLNLWDDNK